MLLNAFNILKGIKRWKLQTSTFHFSLVFAVGGVLEPF
jgi:hypothetical protein